jgi:hypothetical protein
MYVDAIALLFVLLTISTVLCTAGLLLLAHRIRALPVKRDIRLVKLEGDVEDALTRINKLSGRVAREVRTAKEALAEAEPAAEPGDMGQRKGETDLDWKRRVRKLIAAGKGPSHD